MYTKFLIFAFWYLLSILYLKESNLQYPFSLMGVIPDLIARPPFDFPFSPPGQLYLLPPLSLLSLKKKIQIYFNWRLITLQYCIGFAIH